MKLTAGGTGTIGSSVSREKPSRHPGPNGSVISGLWLKALPQDGKPLQGTVLYAHCCTRNMGFHLPQVSWLVPSGWNVILYDPEETGRSTGKLTLNGMVDDAEAV